MILHHLTNPGAMLASAALSLPPALYALVRSGYLAVTTFFVLSGFVLSRSYAGSPWRGSHLLRYGAARIARVYPVYALSLLVMAPFIVTANRPDRAPLLAAHGLLLQGWLWPLPVSWNTPAWSLSCEMFFYLSFPLAAYFMRGAGWGKTVAVALAACCLTRALLALGVPDGIKPVIHFADFLMGIAAARAYELLLKSGRRLPGALLSALAAALSAILIAYPAWLPHRVDLNTALRPLNAALLLGLALGGGAAARVLSSRLFVYLGKSSYAMYILHVPILWWYVRWAHTLSAAVYLVLVLGVSALVYRFIEEPANRYLRSRVHTALGVQVPLQS